MEALDTDTCFNSIFPSTSSLNTTFRRNFVGELSPQEVAGGVSVPEEEQVLAQRLQGDATRPTHPLLDLTDSLPQQTSDLEVVLPQWHSS